MILFHKLMNILGQYIAAACGITFYISNNFGATWTIVNSLQQSQDYFYGQLFISDSGKYMMTTIQGYPGNFFSATPLLYYSLYISSSYGQNW